MYEIFYIKKCSTNFLAEFVSRNSVEIKGCICKKTKKMLSLVKLLCRGFVVFFTWLMFFLHYTLIDVNSKTCQHN